MTDKLRWGFLSTARINNALIEPLRASKKNRLVAVASRSDEKAIEYARKKKIPRSFGSYQELLADPDIDVVYNSLPNHLHAEWTVNAIQSGKHVLCEKPLALSIDEVDAISAAVQKYQKVAAEAFMYRTHAQSMKVREIVEAGELGKIRLVHGSYTFILSDPEAFHWHAEMGGGGLWDVGCYPLSYTRMILSAEPQEVYGTQVMGSTGVDELFTAQLRFPDEVYAQFDCSIKIPHHVYMEIVGEEGTLLIPNPFSPGLREKIYLIKEGKTKVISVKGAETYAGEVEDMADAILLRRPPSISLADSRGNVAAIQALFESARTGKPVML
jgi:xylose dehydrogenase (NAD/NADP)